MSEHTPTPWVLAHRNGQAAIRGPSTECLAVLPYAACEGYGLTDVFEVGANAAFIVKAVNSHPDLVEALKGMVVQYTDLVNSGDAGFWDPEKVDEVKQARAALAKAGIEP